MTDFQPGDDMRPHPGRIVSTQPTKTMKQIEPKSLLLGALIGVGCMFLIAGDEKPDPGPRYQIAAGEAGYILDTVTGEAWATGASRREDFYGKKRE